MKIILADDHHLVRAGLRRVLESFGGHEIVAEAQDGDELFALIREYKPDLVVTDLSMRRLNGDDAIRQIRTEFPSLPVIVVSMHADGHHVRSAMDAGASGYVVKEAAPVEVELAIKAAAAGQTFMSPQVVREQLAPRDEPKLSPRQLEILALLGQGLVTKEIAAKLGMSAKTVETHRARMMQALNLHRASELVRYAILQVEKGKL